MYVLHHLHKRKNRELKKSGGIEKHKNEGGARDA